MALLGTAGACSSGSDGETSATGSTIDGATDGRPVVVVTYPVLGSVVQDLVGDQARVEVLMAPGVDPHDYDASAGDAEAIAGADLVVVNGGDLEEGLLGVIREAETSGVPVFAATDHLPTRHRDDGDHDHDDSDHDDPEDVDHEDEGDHDHGGIDPHFWVDPVAMEQVVAALVPVVRAELHIDVAARAAEVTSGLQDLDAQVRDELSAIPADRRLLVTAHESLGWFADRYGFTVLGSLVPSLTSQANPSAAALAHIAEEVEHHQVPAIFLELGTPRSLAETIAEQAGVRVVELDTHTLPDGGSYADFVRRIAEGIAEGLIP